jgi:hypothetical protein
MLMLIAASYIAHKFTAQQYGLFYKDISPNNIFIVVNAATPKDAVPAFNTPNNSTSLQESINSEIRDSACHWRVASLNQPHIKFPIRNSQVHL